MLILGLGRIFHVVFVFNLGVFPIVLQNQIFFLFAAALTEIIVVDQRGNQLQKIVRFIVRKIRHNIKHFLQML